MIENYSVTSLKCKGLSGSVAVINTLLFWLWISLSVESEAQMGQGIWGEQSGHEWRLQSLSLSSPSRHLFLFLIYLSSASEKVQTVCLVYQSTICLCFNNYTVSCKITLQTITKFCLQTRLLQLCFAPPCRTFTGWWEWLHTTAMPLTYCNREH